MKRAKTSSVKKGMQRRKSVIHKTKAWGTKNTQNKPQMVKQPKQTQ
jgi:hypothetical protein